MRIKERKINNSVYSTCIKRGYPEIVARIIAGRIDEFDKNIFEFTIDAVKPANIMTDCTKAAKRIAQAIYHNETILLFTDYDVDGCTSMAIMYETLHNIFSVPDTKIIKLTGHRTTDGYGLTDPVADKIIYLKESLSRNQNNLNLVITADAGASDEERIKKLADVGIDVIVTDHHIIPKDGVPKSAFAVVNPQRENCNYDSNIAGCGVAWLLMTALSKEIDSVDLSCSLEQKKKIHQLLDYVALGTVADLVPLSSVINRYFVKKGLEFMNRKNRPCWQVALNGRYADTGYLAFQLAPRINASSRMSCEAVTAIEFLTQDSYEKITKAYKELDIFNSNRQKIEKEMFYAAKESIPSIMPPVLIYYSEKNHPGIQGIVAGKLTEHFGIPAIMLADVGDNFVTGSGRAGQFLHIRDALETFDNRFKGVFSAYGGHKAAAGFKLQKSDIEFFKSEFTKIVIEQLKSQDTTPYIYTDGSLKKYSNQISFETYYSINSLTPFGIGFPAPLFNDKMVATDIKIVGKRAVHLSMKLDGKRAVFFNALNKPGDSLPIDSGDFVDVIYTLESDLWQGIENLKLFVKKIKRVDTTSTSNE